jgi:hypothetical protein
LPTTPYHQITLTVTRNGRDDTLSGSVCRFQQARCYHGVQQFSELGRQVSLPKSHLDRRFLGYRVRTFKTLGLHNYWTWRRRLWPIPDIHAPRTSIARAWSHGPRFPIL